MKKLILLLLVLLPAQLAASDMYFVSKPTLTPDGKTVFFAFEGDIWKVATAGGTATRVTAMDGRESAPRVSPDGQWLAFSSSQAGNDDIYVMPLDGGDIRRLTVHDATDVPTSWSWDSKYIYFNSNRYNSVSTYKVSIDGGTPERLFGYFFNRPHDAVIHPKNGDVIFTDTWESHSSPQRKRYKGSFNPDLKSYNLTSKKYEQLTDYEGKDMFPTFDRNGSLYFVSDRDNDEYNLYRFEENAPVRLTQFETSVYYPQVSADGSTIVFTRDYQLWAYDVASGKAAKIPVKFHTNSTIEFARDFKTAGNISRFDVSPDGKKLAFISRGVLFVSDIKGKFVRRMPVTSSERVDQVVWLKDNETLLYGRTVDGWTNLFTIAATGDGAEKRITTTRADDRNLTLDADKKRAVYLSGRNDVKVLDLEKMTTKTVASEELWGFYNTDPSFSPDGNWIAFTAVRGFERDIMVTNLSEGKTYNLTNTRVTEDQPVWSPDGKYIYFHANRTTPSYPTGLSYTQMYRVALERFGPEFRSDEFDKLFTKADTAKSSKADKPAVKVTIDFDRIVQRWEPLGRSSGGHTVLHVDVKDGVHTVLYRYFNDAAQEPAHIYKMVLAPFEAPKTEQIKGSARAGQFVANGSNYFALIAGNIHQVKLANNSVEKIDIDVTFQKNLQEEFVQMFHETWANMDENFYADDFHGVDWDAMKKRYLTYLDFVTTRDHLRILINDLLGELNSSHLGFNSFGNEESIFYTSRSLATGIMFRDGSPYTVDRIVHQTPADNKSVDVRPGDVLTAVNGVTVDPKQNREMYFQAAASLPQEISLTFRRGNQTIETKLYPTSTGNVRNRLHDEWVDINQAKVDKDGKGRIAYIHMKNMGGGELEQFRMEMANEAEHRDALILDLRNNTGGNVHDPVLQLLSQRRYVDWAYRGAEKTNQPNFTPSDKPIILLINEQSLSDAEMTAAGFKALELGTIVGTETYRWIIFTTSLGLVDGSSHRMPAWGTYALDGSNLELTGVAPDVYVRNTFEDNLLGRDPQLDKAIELILKELK